MSKHLVETVKEDKNLQVDFGAPGALYHGDNFKCQVMHAGKNGLNSQRVMCSGVL